MNSPESGPDSWSILFSRKGGIVTVVFVSMEDSDIASQNVMDTMENISVARSILPRYVLRFILIILINPHKRLSHFLCTLNPYVCTWMITCIGHERRYSISTE